MTENIKRLSDYQHIRLKTEMYLGSKTPHTQEIICYDEELNPRVEEMTWVPALYTSFREGFDNALDEVVGHGHGDRIDVTFDENNLEFSIEDNGRGIPFGWDEKEEMYQATLVVSHPRAGRNFEQRGNVAGTNGIGISAVNYCSEWFEITVVRDGKQFSQRFTEGEEELVANEPEIKPIKKTPRTKVSWKLSNKVFKHTELPLDFIKSRVIEIAAVNPKIKFYFNSDRIKVNPKLEKNFFPDSIKLSLQDEEEDFSSDFFIAPDWEYNGEFVHSIVNNIPALNGGTHIDGFRKSFYKNLIQALSTESKRRKLYPNNSDIQQSLLIYNVTSMVAPDFDSQSKTRLINENAQKKVQKYFDDIELYKKIIKNNREWVDRIYERCAKRTQKKDQEELKKLNKKNLKNKIPKLRDANNKDRSKCILLIAEGDSAVEGSFNVRDPQIHAGIPIRGKVMNVHETEPKSIIANEELSNLMNAIGLQLGVEAKRDELNYGKIYIAADMDHDGANITALLVNFFYRFWGELFQDRENPFFYIFQTPYIIAEKGKERRYWYARNYHEYEPDNWHGWEITRAKGLGSLSQEDWKHSLYNPELIPVIDNGKLKETLDLIFNPKRADDRKEWMK